MGATKDSKGADGTNQSNNGDLDIRDPKDLKQAEIEGGKGADINRTEEADDTINEGDLELKDYHLYKVGVDFTTVLDEELNKVKIPHFTKGDKINTHRISGKQAAEMNAQSVNTKQRYYKR